MLGDLQKIYAESTCEKELAILTLAPSSWAASKAAEIFDTAEYKLKLAWEQRIAKAIPP